MKKIYEQPMTSLILVDTKEDILNSSFGLSFDNTLDADINSQDVHTFAGFFK